MNCEFKLLRASYDDDYPQIDFGRKENRAYDWLRITRMCTGELPLDTGILSSVRIEVDFGDLIPDVLDFTPTILVSKRARECLERLRGRLDCFEWQVNGTEFYLVIVQEFCDIVDISRSQVEYFRDGGFKRIAKFVMRQDAKVSVDLFRVPQSVMHIFCTVAAREAILESGLVGFRFDGLDEVDYRLR